jgi:DNA mismatch endonuclease (patch repair protein)
LVVPYPVPTTPAATRIGKANKRQGTKAEVRLRSNLHRDGLRFRKDHLVRAGGVRVHVDVVFTRRRVAIFVDGCFWHGCPEHLHVPKANRDWWEWKLAATHRRDWDTDRGLHQAGWAVVRVWEHEDVYEAADRVEAAWRVRTGRAS